MTKLEKIGAKMHHIRTPVLVHLGMCAPLRLEVLRAVVMLMRR
jgi:hypothetical protein